MAAFWFLFVYLTVIFSFIMESKTHYLLALVTNAQIWAFLEAFLSNQTLLYTMRSYGNYAIPLKLVFLTVMNKISIFLLQFTISDLSSSESLFNLILCVIELILSHEHLTYEIRSFWVVIDLPFEIFTWNSNPNDRFMENYRNENVLHYITLITPKVMFQCSMHCRAYLLKMVKL